MEKATAIIVAIFIVLMIGGSAAAYQVPVEHRNRAMVEIDLYALAKEHTGEFWAEYIIGDIRYKHHARNIEKFDAEMAYQASLPRLVRNNYITQNQ